MGRAKEDGRVLPSQFDTRNRRERQPCLGFTALVRLQQMGGVFPLGKITDSFVQNAPQIFQAGPEPLRSCTVGMRR
jgi:hypothetical protein